MQPFKLKPAYKDYIWGGQKLKTEFGKKTGLATVAESWELSAHPDGSSIITTGELAGTSLSDFFKMYPSLCGTKNEIRADFPILVKLIDAARRLSVQVHPDDAYARVHENDNGKTEMWVVLEAEPGATLYHGFSREVTKEELTQRIEDGTVEEVLRKVPAKMGDVFFIAAGDIHAIGAGLVIAEIQENSNATYRVYDYGRTDDAGNPRPLHIQKALDVTRLTPVYSSPPGEGNPVKANGCTLKQLASCPYFTVDTLALNGAFQNRQDGGSFTAVLCTDGSGLLTADKATLEAKKGDTLFVPSDVAEYALSGCGSFLLITT